MGVMASQITSLTIVYSNVYSGADQRKHQSSASLAFVWGIHREPVNSPHKGPVTRKILPFDDVIMGLPNILCQDITSTTTALFLIERLKNNFNEISFENIHIFREEIEKTVYAKQEPFFFDLDMIQ